MNFGLLLEPLKETDYIFGDNKLGDSPINPNGQWDGWLPDYEPQSRTLLETSACVTFTTLNCVEILERKLFNISSNWSDRFLAKMSGTAERGGNSPARVADILKSDGCVLEKDLPFDITIDTFDKFYAPISNTLKTLAKAFTFQYSFGYSHVPSNAEAMKKALTYSPLLFTVSAWYKDNGLYYRPQGESDNHATTCYGYEDGKYWKIIDSYADSEGSFLKKVKWDSLPMQCKRFTLRREIRVESAWDKFLKLFRVWLGI